jgi:site-specific DNA recombinase
VAEFQAQHTADSSRLHDELAAVARELKDSSAAIDRYLIAFERGTLDDEDTHVRDRLTTLKAQSKQLRGRKAKREIELDRPPQTLTPADQTKIRDRIREILTSGATNARKAMCEAMIKEVLIMAEDTIRPIFKLPLADNDEGLALDGPALSDSEHAVRALPTMVGDTGIEPVTSSV